MMRIYRLFAGEKWAPARKNGCFVLGDPACKDKKHHRSNEVLVRSEEEAIELIGKGFSIRIETGTRPSLVRRNVYVDGALVK
ncbi:hypothetical protein [Chelativorans sp.]|uniref:hypothetical protein n=1 Tax=Chelativorans sp. TaxID=2203393 RepID=UPI0028121292|nr:hypothetical protein [Chelativorans sp.]